MSSFKLFTRGALLAVALCASQTVTASFVPSFGTYDATNAFSSHGLWFGDELIDTDNSGSLTGAAQTWLVESATLTYADGGTDPNTLSIMGTVTNNGFRLGFDFNLSQIADAGDPYCGRPACSNGSQAMKDGVQFFDFPGMDIAAATTSATISGLDALAGLEYVLDIRPTDGSKPPQFGYCGNWVDCALGYSNWFGFELDTDASTLNKIDVAYDRSGHGDLNLTVTPVPLPAAVWLFGTALLGLVGFNRRKRSA